MRLSCRCRWRSRRSGRERQWRRQRCYERRQHRASYRRRGHDWWKRVRAAAEVAGGRGKWQGGEGGKSVTGAAKKRKASIQDRPALSYRFRHGGAKRVWYLIPTTPSRRRRCAGVP